MTTILLPGQTHWSMTRDGEGHRTYKIKHKVESTDGLDGPANVLQTPGLPLPGAFWNFDNDIDLWAWCRPDATVTPVIDEELNRFFVVEQTFSTKPLPRDKQRCNEAQIEDPLLEPAKVSGGFKKFTEEKSVDKDGNQIRTSAFELIRGPQVEFDDSRANVRIEQNVPNLQLELLNQMKDTVNDSTLWGLPARCVKLSSISWEKRFYGQCYIYYNRVLEFDTNINTFDRTIIDEGTKCLRGDWDRDPTSTTFGAYKLDTANLSQSYKLYGEIQQGDIARFKDWNGEFSRVILNGYGKPWDANQSTTGTDDDAYGTLTVRYYRESNFLLLNIPTVL